MSRWIQDWVKTTPAQVARAEDLVANRRAEWMDSWAYPAQATRMLQLHCRDQHGALRGKVYIDARGQVFGIRRSKAAAHPGFAGSYTWREARQHPVLLVYRGYELEPEPHVSGAPMGWGWIHRNYDGPPDRRCGWSRTLAEARREINEREKGR